MDATEVAGCPEGEGVVPPLGYGTRPRLEDDAAAELDACVEDE